MAPSTRSAQSRARSNSLKQGLEQVPLETSTSPSSKGVVASTGSKTASKKSKKSKAAATTGRISFLNDLYTFKWMTNPISSLKIITFIVLLYSLFQLLLLPSILSLLPSSLLSLPYFPTKNPLSSSLFISHPLPLLPTDAGVQRYDKGWGDIPFLLFYVIVFSFVRQATTEYLLRPLAKWSGLKTDAKQVRFMEQAYAVLYNLATGALGLYILKTNNLWWYKTENFWIGYPHWRMKSSIKSYYLLQAAYWAQQMLVLGLRLEKPRSDYYQLVVHHLVTLWLIGWSYLINLTMIGVAIYLSMDIPEIFLAGSKCLNYVGLQHCSEVSFVCLLGVWTYMRHYLNLRILYSVWNEFDLIPKYNRSWVAPITNPKIWWVSGGGLLTGRIPYWIKYQIFIPIFLLHLVNLFWSYLLWRIAWRLVVGVKIADIREEGESDEEGEGEEGGLKEE